MLCVYILCAQDEKAPLSGPQTQHFNYVSLPVTSRKSPGVYVYFRMWVASNYGGSTEATPVCDKMSHVFCWLISVFVFDILRILGGCSQICNGRIATDVDI